MSALAGSEIQPATAFDGLDIPDCLQAVLGIADTGRCVRSLVYFFLRALTAAWQRADTRVWDTRACAAHCQKVPFSPRGPRIDVLLDLAGPAGWKLVLGQYGGQLELTWKSFLVFRITSLHGGRSYLAARKTCVDTFVFVCSLSLIC
jgi:hypothetical protein